MIKDNYDLERIRIILRTSLTKLVVWDLDLIERKVHEKAINHRLAIYLEDVLRIYGWPYHVDIEYNKNGDNPKGYTRGDGTPANAIPDIIVHRRQHNDENLLFFEIKKLESKPLDIEKTTAFLAQNYDYKFACLINYWPDEDHIDIQLKQFNQADKKYQFNKANFELTEIL